MQSSYIFRLAILGSFLPKIRRFVLLLSSGTFVFFGIQHLLNPSDSNFSTFLFFNFISVLPMTFLLTMLLYSLSLRQRVGNALHSVVWKKEDVIIALVLIPSIVLFTGVSIYVYFYLAYTMMGIDYLVLSLMNLLPVLWIEHKHSERYIVTMLIIFLTSSILTFLVLGIDSYLIGILSPNTSGATAHLPMIGDMRMVFVHMCLTCIVIHTYAVIQLLLKR